MSRFLYLGLIILAVSAVAIADVFLKKAAAEGGVVAALKSPWMLGAVLLYLFQIFFFTYVFVAGLKLSIVGTLQTGLYAFITLTAGLIFFGESLGVLQIAGIALTLGGVVLLTI